jgi:exopolysaccharide biosynthesis polyprenyl glycosylphosphotransferase
VGDRTSIVEAAESPVFSQSSGYRIAHELSIDGRVEDVDAIGAELARVIVATRADAVFLIGILPTGLFQHVIEVAHSTGCELMTISRAWKLGGVLPLPRTSCGVHLTSLTRPGLKAHQLFLKRLIDIGFSGLGLIATSPLFVLLAIAVKTTSKGPVFFRQERVGRGGKRFMILKFRTMRIGADDEKADLAHLNHTGDSRLFKIRDDPRITRVGAFLRRWSLDELPQLVNVFRGEMSLVGPRPFFPQDLHDYQDHHFLRLAARPGITGLWQVRGRSDISDFEEVVALDREYIDMWSSWLDLKILAQTIPAVFRRHGAY